VPPGGSLVEVLKAAGLDGRPVAVELDGDVVPRSKFTEPMLAGGERIEIVTFVGGG
jgi:sulfur carrier protein